MCKLDSLVCPAHSLSIYVSLLCYSVTDADGLAIGDISVNK